MIINIPKWRQTYWIYAYLWCDLINIIIINVSTDFICLFVVFFFLILIEKIWTNGTSEFFFFFLLQPYRPKKMYVCMVINYWMFIIKVKSKKILYILWFWLKYSIIMIRKLSILCHLLSILLVVIFVCVVTIDTIDRM